jgi:hypothetical protein
MSSSVEAKRIFRLAIRPALGWVSLLLAAGIEVGALVIGHAVSLASRCGEGCDSGWAFISYPVQVGIVTGPLAVTAMVIAITLVRRGRFASGLALLFFATPAALVTTPLLAMNVWVFFDRGHL